MKWQTVASILASILLASGGYLAWDDIFVKMEYLARTSIDYIDIDERCDDCIAIMYINTTYWEYCFEHSTRDDVLYKKITRGRRLWFNLNKIGLGASNIELCVPSYGKSLRLMKDGDCIKRYTRLNPRVGKIYIKSTIDGYYNIYDGKLVEWIYPIGDRNFEEYGGCREYEKEKGVCYETNLLGK